MLQREQILSKLSDNSEQWDFIIIGGGATGVGAAIDASSRGYKTLLVEQSDFGKGTSSRSTKLIHGGVRYLQQGNISLVLEALKERGLLCQNAPHLVHNLAFVVPNYDWWEGTFYGVGLKLYDMLAGKYGFGKSRLLSEEETLQRIPTLETNGLRGGVIYYDGQFDDSRLLINMVQTADELGTDILNYIKVTSLLKKNDIVEGVLAIDVETGIEYELKAKAVINATGIFTDSIRKMDDKNVKSIFFNIFGGITRCDDVANGIVEALSKLTINLPIVIKLAGTNEDEAKKILSQTELITAASMADGAKKSIEIAGK